MKKIIFFILIIAPNIYAQFDKELLRDLLFTPKAIWMHAAMDSSSINIPLTYGWDRNDYLVESKMLLNNGSLYQAYLNALDLYSGALVEKIDLESGKLLWQHRIDRRFYPFRENPSRISINEKGQLELLGFTNYGDTSDIDWTKGKFNKNILDTFNGNSLYKYDAPALDTNYPKLHSQLTYGRLIQRPDKTIDYYLSWLGVNRVKLKMDEFGKFIESDTQYLPLKLKYVNFFTYIVNPLDDDLTKFFCLRHSFLNFPFVTGDSSCILIDYFDENLDLIKTVDITNQVEKVRQYTTFCLKYDAITLKSIEYDDNTFYGREGHYIFDHAGNLLEHIAFSTNRDDPFGVCQKVLKLKDEPGALLFVHKSFISDGTDSKLAIYKSDGEGNIRLLKNIYLNGYRVLVNELELLENKDLLLSLKLNKIGLTEDDSVRYYRRFLTARWSGADLGLISSTEKEEDKSTKLIVFPNPTTGIVKISDDDEMVAHYRIFEMKGNLINACALYDSQIDIRNLISGQYIIQLYDKQRNLLYVHRIMKQ